MSRKYEIYEVRAEQKNYYPGTREAQGYLPKFWVDHPILGNSLVKLEQNTAPAWSEKISYEIAKLIKLPCARYELANYIDEEGKVLPAVISPSFRDRELRYINGDALLRNLYGSYQYSVNVCLKALVETKVGLPQNYSPDPNIKDGADLFVGYLILDYLIANNDRHSGNFEIGISDRGTKILAPVFDNGASFATDMGDIVYGNKTPREYLNNIVSMFGVTVQKAFETAKSIRPQAAESWIKQLSQIEPAQFVEIFDRVPFKRIDNIARNYALDLIEINRSSILGQPGAIVNPPLKTRSRNKDLERD